MLREEFFRPRNMVVILAIVLIWRFAMKKVFAMLDAKSSDARAN
jgi:hypothetical protein